MVVVAEDPNGNLRLVMAYPFALVQPELASGRFPSVSIPPFGRGGSRHRPDHQVFPQHGCVPGEPASVSPVL